MDLDFDISSSEEELNLELSQTGIQGYSAYEIAVQNGFEGTEQEWLASLRGADGNDGADGSNGITPTITIGTTSTLEAGSNATVSRSGTPTNPIFSFGIPQGIQGEQGEQGIQGIQGEKGDKGDKGDTGTSALDFRVVQVLPTQDISTTTIYLLRNQETSGSNLYDEYVYTNNAWEKIGNTNVDLSGYSKIYYMTNTTSDSTNIATLQKLYDDFVANVDSLLILKEPRYNSGGIFFGYEIDQLGRFILRNTNLFYQSSSNGTFDRIYSKYATIITNVVNDEITDFSLSSNQLNNSDFSNYLSTNTNYGTPYTPLYPGSPATKKYVDDSISSAIGNINTVLATLTTPGNGGGN